MHGIRRTRARLPTVRKRREGYRGEGSREWRLLYKTFSFFQGLKLDIGFSKRGNAVYRGDSEVG